MAEPEAGEGVGVASVAVPHVDADKFGANEEEHRKRGASEKENDAD